MERKIPSSPADILGVLQRRKYWVIIPAALVIALAIVLTPLIPRTYMSTTMIMAQSQNMQSQYVRSGSADAAVEEAALRIQKIGLEVTSGNGVLQVIHKLNLYPELLQQGKTNQVIAGMRKNISVNPVPDTGSSRDGGQAFTISYIGKTPQQAQDVTRELANLFIQENMNDGHQQAQGIDSFLTAQLAQAQQQLTEQQAKIQAFKTAHAGSLPEQAQANIQMIGQYQADLQANSAAIDQDNQQRIYLQSVLNITPSGGKNNFAAPAAASPLQVALAQKQAELEADLLKYTPQYPDVIRLKRDIALLQEQVQNAPAHTGSLISGPISQTTGPTVNDQLRSQLVALNAEIKSRQAHQRLAEAKLAQLQGSFGTVPAVQTEYARLDSDYQEMQKNYNLLLEKQHEAAMATALNQRNEGNQLLIIQPATLPSAPYRPDPVMVHLGAVFIGLLVGLIFALGMELRDDTIHSSEEAAAYLKLPVIVALPKCPPSTNETWALSSAKK